MQTSPLSTRSPSVHELLHRARRAAALLATIDRLPELPKADELAVCGPDFWEMAGRLAGLKTPPSAKTVAAVIDMVRSREAIGPVPPPRYHTRTVLDRDSQCDCEACVEQALPGQYPCAAHVLVESPDYPEGACLCLSHADADEEEHGKPTCDRCGTATELDADGYCGACRGRS